MSELVKQETLLVHALLNFACAEYIKAQNATIKKDFAKEMRHYQDMDIRQWPHCRSARKKDLPLSVRFATEDGTMHTLEGEVAYVRGDALVHGVHNERWPVDAAYFARNYSPSPGTQAGQDGRYYKKSITVIAVRMSEAFSINTPDGSLLRGVAGDWLVQYEQGRYGIVQDVIFAETYELF
jgi:hypothetical protein